MNTKPLSSQDGFEIKPLSHGWVFGACGGQPDHDNAQTLSATETVPVTTENSHDDTQLFVAPPDAVGLVVATDSELITWHEYSTYEDRIDFTGLDVETLGAASANMSLCYLDEDVTFYSINDGEIEDAIVEYIVPGAIVGVATVDKGVQEVYILYRPAEDEEYIDDSAQVTVDEIPESDALIEDKNEEESSFKDEEYIDDSVNETVDEIPESAAPIEDESEERPSFTVLTQNIFFKNIAGGNTVVERQPRFKCLIDEYAPDIICIQECSAEWKYYITNTFGSLYTLAYADSNTGTTENLIFFRTERYEILDSGVIWLSKTPYVLSQFGDASGPRTCNWAFVEDRLTGEDIFVANAHLDWNHDTARGKQLDVLLREFDDYFNSYNAVLCGDFNSTPNGPIYNRTIGVLKDSRITAAYDYSTVDYTYHNFGQSRQLIDYIFHTDYLYAENYQILSNTYGGHVSDHYGVIAEFSFVD